MLDNLRRFACRTCGWLGYLTVIAQYLLVALLYLQAFVKVPVIKTILLPKPQVVPTVTQATVIESTSEPGWIVPLFAAVAVLLVGYAIFHLVTKDAPEAKEKAETVVEKVALKAIKKIEKDKKVSKRQERVLTVRLVFWLKISLTVLPLIVVLVFQNTTMSMSKVAALFLMSDLSLSGVAWFTLERVFYRSRVTHTS